MTKPNGKPQRLTDLERKILDAIRKSKWRGESSLCREFDKGWRSHTGVRFDSLSKSRWPHVFRPARSPEVEDALFALVQAGLIEWFGGGTSGDEPLKYRAVWL